MDTDAVSRLLSLTSHELRSPLGVIRGYLKWLEQQGADLPEQHRQVVTATVKASDRLTDILAELSALAQLLRRETDVAHEPIRLSTLAADVVASFGAQGRTVSLHAAELPDATVTGDRTLLESALLSLATAVSLAQPREPELVLRGRVDASGPHLALELEPSQSAPDAVEVPLNLSRAGLGLRLAMAAQIVAAHGGRIVERQVNGRLSGMIVWLRVEA